MGHVAAAPPGWEAEEQGEEGGVEGLPQELLASRDGMSHPETQGCRGPADTNTSPVLTMVGGSAQPRTPFLPLHMGRTLISGLPSMPQTVGMRPLASSNETDSI